MFPFLRDRLHISIEPNRIAIVRLAGIFRAAVTEADEYQFQLDPNDPSALEGAIAEALGADRWKRTHAHLVLDDRLVRYFISERAGGAKNTGELEQAARAQFEEIFGDDATDWDFRVNLVPFADSYLACACNRRLLASINNAFATADIPLSTIQPFAIAEFNRRQSKNEAGSSWVAVANGQTIWLARFLNGIPTAVRMHSLKGKLDSDLPILLEREQLRHDDPNVDTLLRLLGTHGLDAGTNRWSGLTVTTLGTPLWPGTNKVWSNKYRLALSPVWP